MGHPGCVLESCCWNSLSGAMAECGGCPSLAVSTQLSRNTWGRFTRLSQPEFGTIHLLILLARLPMAPVTLPFARESGPVQGCGKAALPQAGTSPGGAGTSVPGSRRAARCRPSRQSTISPFPPLSVAESRSPAVPINGRSGKQRGLAAAPGCAELAGAAALPPPVPVPVPARSQPAGRRARRQLCPQLDVLARLAPLGQGFSSRSSLGGMGCRDLPGMINARMAWDGMGSCRAHTHPVLLHSPALARNGTERRREMRPASPSLAQGEGS